MIWAVLGTPESSKQHNIPCISNTVDAIHLEMENDTLDLGTEFEIDPARLADNEASYTVDQLISALKATTTLTKLTVYGSGVYEPHGAHQRVMVPLCGCIASLRHQNEHHPLQAVKFLSLDSDIVRQFLVALKQFGIRRVTFWSTEPFPVRWLIDFCRDNSNLKVLKLKNISIADEDAADPIVGLATTTLNLDELLLVHLRSTTSFAATNFAYLLAHMRVSTLVLGSLCVGFDEDSVTERIVSGFKMPSAERLSMSSTCKVKHFQSALDAGISTVIELTVQLSWSVVDNATEKLEYLTRMIRGAVKLNRLTIETYDGNRLSRLPRQLFQALKACASVTDIHVNDDGNPYAFAETDIRKLRRITVRNTELGQFVAKPSTFPNTKLLSLMRQFNKCPTGRYMLTRRLPEVFSFEKGNSLFPLIVEPNPKRKLHKRRKVSFNN